MVPTATLVLSALGALVGRVSAAPASFSEPSRREVSKRDDIAWGDCSNFGVNTTAADPNLKCGYHEVPMDYQNSTAGSARLAVIKYSATADEKKGVLFVNPGGPGVSGVGQIPGLGPFLSEKLGGTYDIVSWDPRGIGKYTSPGEVTCFETAQEQDAFFKNTIMQSTNETIAGKFNDEDSDEFYSRVENTEQKLVKFGEKCQQGPVGKYLQYIGTSSTLRDLLSLGDRLVGEGKPVNFWGLSYGTVIGYHLINSYPSRVGHVILDGVVDPEIWVTYKIIPPSLVDAEKAYSSLTDGCAAAGKARCKLVELVGDGASGNSIKRLINDGVDVALKLHRAGLSPLPYEPGVLRTKIHETLNNPTQWSTFVNGALYPLLANLFQVAQKKEIPVSDDANIAYHIPSETVQFNASLMWAGPPSGTLKSFAFDAIIGADNHNDTGVKMKDVFDVIVNTTRTISPSFGTVWGIGHNYKWPVRSVEALSPVRPARPDNSVLIIGNSGDPITPLAGAQSAARLLGDRATLVEQRTSGHTSLSVPVDCTLDIVKTYLLNSTLPQGHDIQCEGTFELFPEQNTAQSNAQRKGAIFDPAIFSVFVILTSAFISRNI